MPTFTADVEEFRRLGAAVKGADAALRKELFKAVANATKPVKEEVARSARETLPSGGGLNEWVASAKLTVRQAYSGRNPGVTIKAEKAKFKSVRVKTKHHDVIGPLARGQARTKTVKRRIAKTFGAQSDLGAIDRGRVMHPAWGRSKRGSQGASGLFGPQMVTPGFFTRVMEGLVAKRAEKEILAALDRLATAVASGRRAA